MHSRRTVVIKAAEGSSNRKKKSKLNFSLICCSIVG